MFGGELQVHPSQLAFNAVLGKDVPAMLTLFNPHPKDRVAFKIKTTASSTYRVWPNSGVLEPGVTNQVQVLLLGTKVDLADPQCLETCKHDRFQVQYIWLEEEQEFQNEMFKLLPGLVRDVKMTVDVVVVEQPVETAQPEDEQSSPWEGMVRISLMRMMADEERDPASNAACLTKFCELLVLNSIMSTEQMWEAFNLVGEMYQSTGEGQKVMSKVDQWLDNPELLATEHPDQDSYGMGGHSDISATGRGTSPARSELDQQMDHNGADGHGAEEFADSRPAPFNNVHLPSCSEASADIDDYRVESRNPEAANRAPSTSEEPDNNFGSVGSSRSSHDGHEVISDAEDVSVGNSEDHLGEVTQLADSMEPRQKQAAQLSSPRPSNAPTVEAEMAKVRALASEGTGDVPHIVTDIGAAQGAGLAAATIEQRQAANERWPGNVRSSRRQSLLSQIAPSASTEGLQQSRGLHAENSPQLAQNSQDTRQLLAAAAAQIDVEALDLDEAFSPEMLAEARAQMATANTVMNMTSVVPATGPHMLSFADRAAMYGTLAGSRGSPGNQGKAESRLRGALGSGEASTATSQQQQQQPQQPSNRPRTLANRRRSLSGMHTPGCSSADLSADHRTLMDYRRHYGGTSGGQSPVEASLGRSRANFGSRGNLRRDPNSNTQSCTSNDDDNYFRQISLEHRRINAMADQQWMEADLHRSSGIMHNSSPADSPHGDSAFEGGVVSDFRHRMPRAPSRGSLRDHVSGVSGVRNLDFRGRHGFSRHSPSGLGQTDGYGLDARLPNAYPATSSGFTGEYPNTRHSSHAEESLGPAVRVLLAGKQQGSMTNGDLASAEYGLMPNGRDASRFWHHQPLPQRTQRVKSPGMPQGPDSAAVSPQTPPQLRQSPQPQLFRLDPYDGISGGAPIRANVPIDADTYDEVGGMRKKKSFLDKIGSKIAARAQEAARAESAATNRSA